MTRDEVLRSLCDWDRRNPEFEVLSMNYDLNDPDDQPPQPRTACYCDNCFYGRDEMAVYILELLDQISDLENADYIY